MYEGEGKATVCANVTEHKGFFGRHFSIKNTGSCVVTSEDLKRAEDDGWSIRRYRAIDTYFEVRWELSWDRIRGRTNETRTGRRLDGSVPNSFRKDTMCRSLQQVATPGTNTHRGQQDITAGRDRAHFVRKILRLPAVAAYSFRSRQFWVQRR